MARRLPGKRLGNTNGRLLPCGCTYMRDKGGHYFTVRRCANCESARESARRKADKEWRETASFWDKMWAILGTGFYVAVMGIAALWVLFFVGAVVFSVVRAII